MEKGLKSRTGIQTHVIGWVLALGLLLGVPAGSDAASYTFTQIAETSSAPGGFRLFGTAAINDSGTVAFSAALNSGVGGIFTSDGTTLATIADSSGRLSLLGPPAINDGGAVAFWVSFDAGGHGIVRSDGTTLTTIADTSGPFSSFGTVPAINDGGAVAFKAFLRAGGSGLFTSDGTTLTTIADTTVGFSGFGDPSLNRGGTAAFQGFLVAGTSRGLFTSDGTTLATIADSLGPFNFFGAPSLNEGGTVAFQTSLDMGGSGLFTGPDPTADKVIAVDDPLAGSPVTELVFGRAGLNKAGQVAFVARLADGSERVYRADPVSATVPVTVVITPGGNPNSINLRSWGTVPVAILSTAGFDATTVNPLTVALAGASVALKKNDTPMTAFEDVNGDGRLDLVVHINTQALQLDESDTEAVLEGKTFDGVLIAGADHVHIIIPRAASSSTAP